ncbi:hypothetical protein BJ875DRAFT_455559 [Amylocarpus encephaloides]|uniref:Zn(2)-C6 fungal-type domain-containing protein n=1 Tax=Amylocarpus encephaloides TaxID=45428 RepID=A0A9P7YPF3_9HELO|nr:hypothetical protein BJ875DRAFT_455559 [Amylocarpus encephaloides]
MFLITSRANPSQKRTESPAPKSEQSLAKFSRARVQKACERCRVKKIKCNGEIPCQRCQQDEVFCTSRKREPGDLKAASRDYISTLESQQKTFITTLQKISRNYPQSIDVEGMREIVALAKSHGYEFEGTMDDHGVKPENGVSIEQRGIKRPRGNDAAIDMLRTTTADDTSSGDFLKTRPHNMEYIASISRRHRCLNTTI